MAKSKVTEPTKNPKQRTIRPSQMSRAECVEWLTGHDPEFDWAEYAEQHPDESMQSAVNDNLRDFGSQDDGAYGMFVPDVLPKGLQKKFDAARNGNQVAITKRELEQFVRWARATDYDMESGPVNLYCQGYDADNCEVDHSNNPNGDCLCFTGMVMSDFDEDMDEPKVDEPGRAVDVAEWWSNFQFWGNVESKESKPKDEEFKVEFRLTPDDVEIVRAALYEFGMQLFAKQDDRMAECERVEKIFGSPSPKDCENIVLGQTCSERSDNCCCNACIRHKEELGG